MRAKFSPYYLFFLIGLSILPACAVFPLDSGPSAGFPDDWRARGGLDSAKGAFNEEWVREAQDRAPRRSPSSEFSRENQIAHVKAHRDITVGMSMRDVQSVWGIPGNVEIAGSPEYGNQRWIYYLGLSRWNLSDQRIVYFENGRVAGWQSTR